MSNEPEYSRGRLANALKQHFEKNAEPRSTLALIITLTGVAGFGLSVFLLKLGLSAMAFRYPLAVLGAYAAFLAFVRFWVEFERSRVNRDVLEIADTLQGAPETKPMRKVAKSSSSFDWLDVPDFLGDGGGEGCLIALLIGTLIGLVALAVSLLDGAPMLLSELFIDVALSGLLYRRLTAAANEHWLGTAIRKTWVHVLLTMALLCMIGFCLDEMAPHSKTAGKAIKEILSGAVTH